ncbi:MAG: hypothetical protein N2D54_00390, partial [Chloroflexota bacterium]
MKIIKALRINPQTRMAFVGAGGKSSAMFKLARQYGKPIVVTASTHLMEEQLGSADWHCVVESPDDLAEFSNHDHAGVMLITGALGEDQRSAGLSSEILGELDKLTASFGFPMLIEADGSRQKPLKSPGA